ncbi:hypothetical protein [Salana multivorans]
MISTRAMRTRTLSTLGAAAALALTLAACSGGDSTTTEETSDAATAAEETSSEAAPEETATEEESSEEAPPAASGDLASCIIGTWEMDTSAIQEEMKQMMGDAAEMEMTVDGYSRVIIDASTWTSDVDTTASFSMSLGEQAMEGSSVTKGTMVVEYSLEGDQLTQTNVVSAEGEAVTTVAGQEQSVDFASTAEAALGIPQTVTCDDTTMTLTAEAEGISMTQRFARQ